MKILHLTLKRKWFDLIASGEKKVEYRENKRYWARRLMYYHGENAIAYHLFDEIHFRNGYSKNAPFMRVNFGGIFLDSINDTFCIQLGGILEIKNYDEPISRG